MIEKIFCGGSPDPKNFINFNLSIPGITLSGSKAKPGEGKRSKDSFIAMQGLNFLFYSVPGYFQLFVNLY